MFSGICLVDMKMTAVLLGLKSCCLPSGGIYTPLMCICFIRRTTYWAAPTFCALIQSERLSSDIVGTHLLGDRNWQGLCLPDGSGEASECGFTIIAGGSSNPKQEFCQPLPAVCKVRSLFGRPPDSPGRPSVSRRSQALYHLPSRWAKPAQQCRHGDLADDTENHHACNTFKSRTCSGTPLCWYFLSYVMIFV